VSRRVVLRGLIGVGSRIRCMTTRGMRVVGGHFVIALFVMLGRLVMMLRGLFMMMCSLLMVVRTLMICHCRPLRYGLAPERFVRPARRAPLPVFHATKRHGWKKLI
jgi:hypothetical protein